jgi:hypothetical protein
MSLKQESGRWNEDNSNKESCDKELRNESPLFLISVVIMFE